MKELSRIPSDKIDYSDRRFIFQAQQPPASHELPAFYKENDRYIPLKEYDLNKGMIDAFVYASDSTYSEMIKDLIIDADLSIFDQAEIMNKLERYENSVNKKEWSKLFHISADKWSEIKSLTQYEKAWRDFFIEKKAPLKRVLHFRDKELRETLKSLLDLNPGINILESIAMLLKESAHKEKCDIAVLWQNMSISDIISEDDIVSSLKLKMIKDKIYAKRYPTISHYQDELNGHLKTIPRAAGLDLRSDENFETPGMRLTADLRSKQDIENFQTWLKEHQQKIEKIIDIQKGNIDNEQK